jgi:hypothetical protein
MQIVYYCAPQRYRFGAIEQPFIGYAGFFLHQLLKLPEVIMEIIEEKNRNNLFLNDNTANPAPLELCAFGMTPPCDGNLLWRDSPGYRWTQLLWLPRYNKTRTGAASSPLTPGMVWGDR